MIAIESLDKHKKKMYQELSAKDQAIELERQQKHDMELLVKEME
jgi:hypothetical protein